MKKIVLSILILYGINMSSQVGIGTTNPDEKLHIEGGSIKIVDGSQAKEKVLTTDTNGKGVWQYANGDGGRGTSTFIVGHFTSAPNTIDIFHLKMPYKPTVDSKMYHIKVTGYAYGAGPSDRVIDITYVGYSYTVTSSVIRQPQIFITGSTNITAGQYIGSDGYIYLWFKTPNVYFNSFGVTSMYVGNGEILNKGDITVIQNSAITL